MPADIKPIVIKSLESAIRVFTEDLKALPESAFDQKFGGKARTVADIVHEVNLVNDHIGRAVTGQETFEWPDGWITAPDDVKAKDPCIAAFESSAGKALEIAETFTEDQLTETISSENGETTRGHRLRFLASHMWYHSGQLNFIQTLLGDDDWHW